MGNERLTDLAWSEHKCVFVRVLPLVAHEPLLEFLPRVLRHRIHGPSHGRESGAGVNGATWRASRHAVFVVELSADLAAAAVGLADDARPIAPVATVKATVLNTLLLPALIIWMPNSVVISLVR